MIIDWTAVVEGALGIFSVCGMGVALWVRSTTLTQITTTITGSCKDGSINSAIDAKVERAVSHLYDRINGHEGRLTRVEAALADLPRSKDVHEIAIKVTEMVGELKAVRTELHSQGERSKRQEQQLDKVEAWAIEAAQRGNRE